MCNGGPRAAYAPSSALQGRKNLPRRFRRRRLIRRLVGDAGLGEGRHAGVAGERGAQDEHRQGGAGGFAEPHVEIDQRLKPKLIEQHAVPGLGGDVRGERMRQRVGAQLMKRRHRGGADEAVEQDRNVLPPRRQGGAEYGGELAAAERRGNAQWVVSDGARWGSLQTLVPPPRATPPSPAAESPPT